MKGKNIQGVSKLIHSENKLLIIPDRNFTINNYIALKRDYF